jgi:hypothetical protein
MQGISLPLHHAADSFEYRKPHTQKTTNAIFGFVKERRKLRGREMRVTFEPDWTARTPKSRGMVTVRLFHIAKARKAKTHFKHTHL